MLVAGAVIAALSLIQTWLSDQAEAVRRIDAAIIQTAAEQSTLTQRIGTLAMMQGAQAKGTLEVGGAIVAALRAAKRALDPAAIMNPGVLIDP